jgi:hypothetical protein
MNAIQKKYPAHPITLCNGVCIGVKRRSTQSQDISGVLRYANILTSSEHNAWNSRGSVTLSFEGYDTDPRELWEIPEVRAYVKKLTDAWPSWMYFVDNSMNSFIAMYLCLVEVQRTPNLNITCAGAGCAEALTHGFEGINDLCEQFRFSEEICEEATQRVAAALGMNMNQEKTTFKNEATSVGGVT